MSVRTFAVVFLCLSCLSTLAAPAPAQAEHLSWVERRSVDDLLSLRTAGIPVVFETQTGLLVEGGAADLARLTALGYEHRILDRAPDANDYWLVAVRPDSDVDLVRSLGPVLLERENWLLIAVARGTEVDALHPARVFVTRVPHEPMAVPRPSGARGSASARGVEAATANPLVQKIVDNVTDGDIQQFWLDLTGNPPSGTRYTTFQGCFDAADYCHETYVGLGLAAEYQSYSANDAPNVIGTIEGALWPDRVYIGIGHLDDLPSSGPAPGADDNASGSVFVLESANAMACWAFKSTVKFINVTGEETGLNGSNAYAADAQARGEDIRGVINMDMPGWEGDGVPAVENLDVSYNTTSQWLGELFAQNAATYGTGLVVDAFYCPSLSASDHWPFWQRGWSAIIGITDNEGYCGHGGNYPYYHTSDDTIVNCGDPSFFYSAVRTGVATLAELAQPFKVTFAQDFFACNTGSLEVLVGDGDLDTDPGSVQTVTVTVWSDTEPTPESLVLTERDPSSMIFSGTMATTQGPPASGDGVLSVSPNDTVYAAYTDALDCDGTPAVGYTATALIDCAEPLISNVDETGVSDVQATVQWLTDEDATSVVRWGESVPPATPTDSPGMDTDHAVLLDGLQSCTVYYYEVESSDVAGNTAVDDSGGRYYRFETLGDFGSGLQPCHAGQVSVGAAVYPCGGSVSFEVVDLDLNADTGVAETVTLEVSSSSETGPETVIATETGANTSVFAGTIASGTGPPVADGVLQVADGDVITVTYRDADDGTGQAAISFDIAVADCAGPVISDLRVDTITDSRATIHWNTDEAADTWLEWGPTPALGNVLSSGALTTAHAVTISEFDTCATFYFVVRGTDARGNGAQADDGGEPFALRSWDVPGLYAMEDFEGDTSGWTLEGEWETGPAQGLGGSSGDADPVVAYNDRRLLGHDLSGQGVYGGDYEPAVSENAISPTWDASSWTNTKLVLYRRLNAGLGDPASLYLFTDGVGRPLFNTAGALHSDGTFQKIELPVVAQFVDGSTDVHLEFRQATNAGGQYSGWNVDDIIFKDGTLPDYAACMDCGETPAFGGAVAAVDDDACGAGGVTVSWDDPVAWGSGAGGSFAVYRDTAAGFTPSAGNRIAAGVAATSYHDASAPTDQTLYYLVLAESDETCGGGPNNGGMLDDNRNYAAVDETTSAPGPQEVFGLRVDMVNHAHARVSWPGASGATGYRIYRSGDPAQGFVQLDETASLVHEDLNQGGNSNSYYYLVHGVNACGVEGP